MKKKIFLIGLISIFFLIGFAEEDLIKIEASLIPKNLSKGKEGKVILKLDIQEGIIIIPQPFFIVEFDPCPELLFAKNSYTDSDLKIEILEENGEEYLNLKKPIEISFTVQPKARQGNHQLEGKIKYFACSKEEVWCLKSAAKFSAPFSIRK